MKTKKLLSIPPRWVNIIGGVVICIMISLLIYFKIDAPYPQSTPTIMLIVTLGYMAFSTVSYDLEEQHLVTKYCGIPIFRTPWHKITYAVYLPEIKKKRGRKSCVVLSTFPGEPYIPTKNEEFLHRNPFTTIRINIYEFETESCLQALTRCIGFVHRLDSE
ncbi:MAG: hypothetical protein IKC09_10450 [Oscillospiraceae bacterium]|nr:hypothetical protein [Oscillospiraceae bacterium]